MSLGGGLSGALSGAQIGSFGGPIGTAVGAIGGGLLGAFGGGKKPKVPTPADIAQQQLEFRGAFLPGLLQQQRDLAPQFGELDLALTQQFAPQFAQVSRDILTQANPVQAAALQSLGDVIGSQPLTSVGLDPALTLRS